MPELAPCNANSNFHCPPGPPILPLDTVCSFSELLSPVQPGSRMGHLSGLPITTLTPCHVRPPGPGPFVI